MKRNQVWMGSEKGLAEEYVEKVYGKTEKKRNPHPWQEKWEWEGS